ncbi:MAG: sigma-54-dependent Fis family transcriptional regulator [Calditrichaeota bacterium]|nr:MAG: sigma-54-dependent Fis family transcriptional regulator [Calditrichota bacterium]
MSHRTDTPQEPSQNSGRSRGTRLKVLAVDDEQPSLNAIFRTLRRQYEVVLSLNAHSALEVLKTQEVAVVLADQRMPEMTGVALLRRAQEIQPEAMRILITGYADIDAIIQAVNEGKIFYYLHKPWEPEELRAIVARAAEQYRLKKENLRLMKELAEANQLLQSENRILHQEVERHYRFDAIVGESPAMKAVFHLMKKVIPTNTTVLLIGETGTGKELVARAIHYNGPRKERLFLAQNCAALPDTLLESALFGHVKGAFTGAHSDQKGIFELADGGTVFLDEVSEMSPAMQQRLLRVLQEGEIFPLGAEKPRKVDVRIISATNRDLQSLIQAGKFREDLYYRLNVFPIRIPPLRERREDIPLLANHFLKKHARRMGKSVHRFAPEALAKLMEGDYPGNVRQLENIIERAIALAESETITPDLIELEAATPPNWPGSPPLTDDLPDLRQITETMERFYIQEALRRFQGNITRAAQALGLSRMGLHKKLRRYGLKPHNGKPRLQ